MEFFIFSVLFVGMLFVFVMMIMFGLNNMMLFVFGVNFGFCCMMLYLFGISIGVVILMFCVGFGFGEVFKCLLLLYMFFEVVSVVYLLYFVWCIGMLGEVKVYGVKLWLMMFIEVVVF